MAWSCGQAWMVGSWPKDPASFFSFCPHPHLTPLCRNINETLPVKKFPSDRWYGKIRQIDVGLWKSSWMMRLSGKKYGWLRYEINNKVRGRIFLNQFVNLFFPWGKIWVWKGLCTFAWWFDLIWSMEEICWLVLKRQTGPCGCSQTLTLLYRAEIFDLKMGGKKKHANKATHIETSQCQEAVGCTHFAFGPGLTPGPVQEHFHFKRSEG